MGSILKNYKWFFAIMLCLALGLGTAVVSAHSHIDGNSGHLDPSCDICILPSIAATVSVDTAIDHPLVQKTTAIQIDASIPRTRVQSSNLARAPPQHL
jgi:hypothetical protein|tara:strand:+ start:264 stop:557 length:294 start_codon:yes stop_codon:yes gene_type:complete